MNKENWQKTCYIWILRYTVIQIKTIWCQYKGKKEIVNVTSKTRGEKRITQWIILWYLIHYLGGQGICLWPLPHTISLKHISWTQKLNVKKLMRKIQYSKYEYQISGEISHRKNNKCDFLKIIISSMWKIKPNLEGKQQIAKKFHN